MFSGVRRRCAVLQTCFNVSLCSSRRFAFSSSSSTAAAVPVTLLAHASSEAVGRLAFDASKAGLQTADKAHVEKVIRAASKNSAFYKSEQRKDVERTVRHKVLIVKQRAFRKLPPAEQQEWAAKAEAVEAELEATRTFDRRFIHIDMDMFYAAVEEKFNPSLRDRPFAVGSFAMLATSNYHARRFGVRSGMPGFIAKKLCPQLWIQPLHFDLYRAEAAAVRAIAAEYDPNYVTVGLDELTMDVTDYLQCKNKGKSSSRSNVLTADAVCAEFRARVEAATQLTCSGGVSHTAAFAKLATGVQKPNGQHTVTLTTRDEVLRHVRDMPVRDVPGVGAATEHQLRALGITICSDFLTRKAELCYLFREKTFAFYLSAGLGLVRTHVDRAIAERAALSAKSAENGDAQSFCSSSVFKPTHGKRAAKTSLKDASLKTASVSAPLQPTVLQKSTGKSITVSRGLPSPAAFRTRLGQLVRGAHDVLVQQGTGTRHVSLHTINHDFVEHSHSTTLRSLTASYGTLRKAAMALADPYVARHREFRLIRITFNQLQPMVSPKAVHDANVVTLKRNSAEWKNEPALHYPKRRQAIPQQAKKGVKGNTLPAVKASKPPPESPRLRRKARQQSVRSPSKTVKVSTAKPIRVTNVHHV